MVGILRTVALCFVLATVGGSLASQSKPSGPPKQRVAKSDSGSGAQNSDTANKEAGNSPNVTVIVKQDSPQNHKPDESKDDENIAIQRKLANFTFWLVVVGFIQAGILTATVWVIRRQITTSRHIERAWVFADIEHDSQKWADRKVHILQGSGTSGDTTGFYAVLICRNEGRSPAWLIERRARFAIVDFLPLTPDLAATEAIDASPTQLGTGKAIEHTDRLSFQPIAQGHEQFGRINLIYGVVRYRDIFGKIRQTTFGYRLTPDRKFVRLEGEQYRKYNENT